jgi:hypothetical protein
MADTNLVLDRAVFVAMSDDPTAQKAYYETHGFCLLPHVIPAAEVGAILTEMGEIKDSRPDWTGAFDYQHLDCRTQYSADAEYGSWPPPAVDRLIANPRIVEGVRALFGEEMVFFKGVYVHSVDRPQRQGLHRDWDPNGQGGQDWRNSCVDWCNIGIYTTDQSPENGPLWIIPGSSKLPRHISKDGEARAADARMVCAQAGDAGAQPSLHSRPRASASAQKINHRTCCNAVVFHCTTFHAGGGHTLERMPLGRQACFHSYRPVIEHRSHRP